MVSVTGHNHRARPHLEAVHQRPRGRSKLAAPHTMWAHTHTHTPFNVPFSGTTQVSQYQKGKTNLDFTEARDSQWQWHQLGHMQVCISLQTDNHASTPPLSFLQAGCPSCHPTNSVKALWAAPVKAETVHCYNECIVGCTEEVLGGQDITAHHCYLRTTGVHLQRWLTKR